MQIFNSRFCVLGKIDDRRLAFRICPWIEAKLCRIKEANLSKEWTCLRILRVSHKIISAGFLQWLPVSTDILRFTSDLLNILQWSQTSDFELISIVLIKIR